MGGLTPRGCRCHATSCVWALCLPGWARCHLPVIMGRALSLGQNPQCPPLGWDPDQWAEEGEAMLLWDHLCAWQWPPLYLQVGFMVVPRAAGGTPSTRSFWADLRVVLCF